ncbi:hypothetical protein ACQP1K_04735 [Sphaerimonospora sp. CA-214678]|uniref:hypothetical protein n=1 Tax=Sphaerimonospora sp. CA-214678 TaxID=3240029 RepID=UPI003D94E020
MGRVTRGAAAGIILLGAIGCTAQAESADPGSRSASPTSTEPLRSSRQDIRVTVQPERIVAGSGKTVHVTAACPLPQGGPEYRATARSDAFTGLVTLVPPTRRSGEPAATPASATIVPELRGSAVIRENAKPGGYRVQVRCEATNDIGEAGFRVVEPEPKPAETKKYPTRAPHAGGGGMAAGGPDGGSALPVGVTVAVLLAAAGVGIGVVRRRSASDRRGVSRPPEI